MDTGLSFSDGLNRRVRRPHGIPATLSRDAAVPGERPRENRPTRQRGSQGAQRASSQEDDEPDPDAIAAAALGGPRAVQKHDELSVLLGLLIPRHPRTVLEIGSMWGGTIYAWLEAAPADALVISVDAAAIPSDRLPEITERARPGQHVEFVHGDSHAPETRRKVLRVLRGRLVDFLFIDGDHTYDGVRQDYEEYSLLVRPGGLIGFHDIATESVPDVGRYWRHVRRRPYREILHDQSLDGETPWGIGVLVNKAAEA